MWYAIQVATGREESIKRVCEKMLDRKVYEAIFIIRFNRAKRYYGKWHRECEIMFPGYLFIDTEHPLELYENLKNIPEITKLLGREEELFLSIEANKEAFFKSMLNIHYEIDISKGIIIGDKVLITEGPLMGNEGMIKKINRHKRIAILSLEMFGQSTDVTVGLEIVSKK